MSKLNFLAMFLVLVYGDDDTDSTSCVDCARSKTGQGLIQRQVSHVKTTSASNASSAGTLTCRSQYCPMRTESWATKCKWINCRGCVQCSLPQTTTPTTTALWQSTGSQYWVDDGCHTEVQADNRHDDYQGEFVDGGAPIASPRCCSSDGTSCRTPMDCRHPAAKLTYAQAAKRCEDVGPGFRLCTKAELLSEVCCGTGGDCDNYKVWTSTQKNAPSTTITTTTTLPSSEESSESAGQCKRWCSWNMNAWTTKCKHNTCSGCGECNPNYYEESSESSGQCQNWCAKNTKTWTRKCKHDTCSACDECNQESNEEASESSGQCQNWCAKNTKSWTRKCKHDTCSACDECNQASDDDAAATGCKDSCFTNKQSWRKKCKWDSCNACKIPGDYECWHFLEPDTER